MVAPQLCVGAVICQEGRLLLVRRRRPPGQGTWSIPGGRVQEGEALDHAVVREVAEETGLVPACGELLGWDELVDDDHHYLIADFTAEVVGGAPVAGDDAIDVAWVPVALLPSYLLAPGLADFLGQYMPEWPGPDSR